MNGNGTDRLIAERASAYDAIYRSWHAKVVTKEWYEQRNQFYLDCSQAEDGRLNGDEIMLAHRLIGGRALAGKRILDYCCGTGLSSIYMALCGARVWAIDASQEAMQRLGESARLSGVQDRLWCGVMDARRLAFPDGHFDAVFCQSALHIIIDYPECPQELVRVLVPGGMAVFCEEALGHNPILKPIRWLRRQKYRVCGGHDLTLTDVRRFGEPFARYRIHHFNLLSQIKTLLGDRVRRSGIKRCMRGIYAMDRWILARMPWMGRYYGKMVVEYHAPGSTATA